VARVNTDGKVWSAKHLQSFRDVYCCFFSRSDFLLGLAVIVFEPAGFCTTGRVASHDLTGTYATRVISIEASTSEHAL
jgi:hypothetical protein